MVSVQNNFKTLCLVLVAVFLFASNHSIYANDTEVPVSPVTLNPQFADIEDGANIHREKSRFYNTLGRNQWMADERVYSKLFSQDGSAIEAVDAYNLARKHWEFGHVQHAQFWLEIALVGQPQNVQFLRLWVQVQLKQKSPLGYEAELNQQFFANGPKSHQAAFLLGLLFEELHQPSDACKAYQRYLAFYPESILARYALEKTTSYTELAETPEPVINRWD